MSNKEEFNPWQWDRENARSGRAKLTVDRAGHEVTLDHRGISINGKRVVHDDPAKGEHGFEVTKDGTVMYRGKAVASVGTTVCVWGEMGASNDQRREREESERRERDGRYRDSQARQQEIGDEGREVQ
ncbi:MULTISPECIES: hypothetical protein [unclassified Streptomyces]|uniref:hypothetical protein n=1 Tax=unclassified Streptomyces TaxID=2593676 RepID=UPI00278C7625|nr:MULTISPECIES: hypothetical protein [unclassified Streptomyces]